MEHIITELAVEVVQKHTAIEGDVVVTPSDDFFWFHRPKLVLHLIHIVLFQNAFEIAFFFILAVGKDTKASSPTPNRIGFRTKLYLGHKDELDGVTLIKL
jgi:hypothetical protein